MAPEPNRSDRLPPEEMWPDRTLERAGLRNGDTINVAEELLRPHLQTGGADRLAVIKSCHVDLTFLYSKEIKVGLIITGQTIAGRIHPQVSSSESAGDWGAQRPAINRVSQRLPTSSMTLSAPAADKWRKHAWQIDPLLPSLETVIRRVDAHAVAKPVELVGTTD